MKRGFLPGSRLFSLMLLVSLIHQLPTLKADAAQPIKDPSSQHYDLVVAQDGSGDFLTLTEAINTLPMYTYERVVIYVKNGIYEEKIRLEQDNITIIGENVDSTVIQYSQLRSDWEDNKDFIGPAVINLHADNIILKNLTIINTQPLRNVHAFAVYGTGTRIILFNCKAISKGGDTVSLWNYKSGMYYHNQCYFEGGVDFVCPRGWCYITDSRFYEVRETAALWHAGVLDKNQKMVIRNSSFDGATRFDLGRHHYEAQFFLIDCTFSKNVNNRSIYRSVNLKNPEKNRPYFWGDRYYFYNCQREGGNYKWFENNLEQSGISNPGSITASWTFDGQWDPEQTALPVVIDWDIRGKDLYLNFQENLTIRGQLTIKTASGNTLKFKEGRGRKTLRFEAKSTLSAKDLKKGLQIVSGSITANTPTVNERILDSRINLPKN